jgi:hypothetical protein
MTDTPVLVIDGERFSDFDGFCREFSSFLDAYVWQGSLDAFNDILRGGFGTPEGGFVLRWEHSEESRIALGYETTALRLESLLRTCHPTNREQIASRLESARIGVGPTLFDELVEIIRIHGPGGDEAANGVELQLA